MKKIILCFLSALILFNFCSCSKAQTVSNLNNIDEAVAIELEKYDENLDDETLKSMSVILRTNLTLENNFNNASKPSEKYLNISSQTSGEVLKNKEDNLEKIYLENNENYSWSKSIKKSNLLDFAMQNNISLTNISKIEPIENNERISEIKIGNKIFDYQKLANQFDLESNIIENISSTNSYIVINGKNKGFYNYFDKFEAEKLSKNNKKYKEILNNFYSDLTVEK